VIAALKQWLRRQVLTADEQQLLADAPRAVWRRRVLRTLLNSDQVQILDALETPGRWLPQGEPLTKDEAEGWGAALRSPTGLKVDIAMINLAQDEAQRAIHAPAAELQRMAGYAAGFRASWLMAKSISTIAGADAGTSEGAGDTGSTTLEHLNP